MISRCAEYFIPTLIPTTRRYAPDSTVVADANTGVTVRGGTRWAWLGDLHDLRRHQRDPAVGDCQGHQRFAHAVDEGSVVGFRSQCRSEVAMAFPRITINPNQMGGLPCIRGLRIPVATVIGQLAARRSHAEVLADFPDLEDADLLAALEYAAAAVEERELPAASGQ